MKRFLKIAKLNAANSSYGGNYFFKFALCDKSK